MVDRITIAVDQLAMKVQGQPVVVLSGSQIDVASAAAFAPSHVTNVQLGTGSLLNGQHNNPVANFRTKQ
jgi:hypothetical protein